jgi:ABC-type amino acid transport substrate-binding protein
MHTLALALLGAHSFAGRLRADKGRLARFALASGAALALVLAASHFLLLRVLPGPENAAGILDRLRVSGAWGKLAPSEVLTGLPTPIEPPERGRRLEEIRRRGSLRFGFTDDQVPWSFRNRRGEVVGVEADLAHALASSLGVRLELVPVGRDARADALAAGSCDVAAGRVEPDQAVTMWFSRSFSTETWAFLVPDHERERFQSLERVRAQKGVRIAVLRVPEWVARLEALFPDAQVLEVDSIEDYVSAPSGRFDAMYTGFARATAYSLLHPGLTVVAPEPALGSVPIALAVPKGEEALLALANAWLEEETASGLLGEKLDYWVRGEGARRERGPRWSIGRNVLRLWE